MHRRGLAVGGHVGADGARSLGAVFYEPLWVFARAGRKAEELQDLRGLKVAIGPEGSGVRVLATLLLTEAGLAMLTSVVPNVYDLRHRMLAPLDTEEQREFMRLLRKFVQLHHASNTAS